MQTVLYVGDESFVRSPDENLRHAVDVTQETTYRLESLMVRRLFIRSIIGLVDFMTEIGLIDLNELFITTRIVISVYPTTQVRTELNYVGIGTDKVVRHLLEVPPSRMI